MPKFETRIERKVTKEGNINPYVFKEISLPLFHRKGGRIDVRDSLTKIMGTSYDAFLAFAVTGND